MPISRFAYREGHWPGASAPNLSIINLAQGRAVMITNLIVDIGGQYSIRHFDGSSACPHARSNRADQVTSDVMSTVNVGFPRIDSSARGAVPWVRQSLSAEGV